MSDEDIERAADILRAGGIVAVPTETVYGLACSALNKEAAEKVFAAKGRPADNPLIVHINSVEWLYRVGREIPESCVRLTEEYWPGPLSVIVKKTDLVPDNITCRLDSVAVRLPAGECIRKIIDACGFPLAAPSANSSGRPSPTRFFHVIEDLDGRIDAAVDGGDCEIGLESTVIDFTIYPPVVLRPGGITLEQVRKVIPQAVAASGASAEDGPKSPGMKYRHYAPEARLVLVTGDNEAVIGYINKIITPKTGILCYNEVVEKINGGIIIPFGSAGDVAQAAKGLFAALREFDRRGAKTVYAQMPTDDGIGEALRNRMIKASDEIIKL